MGNPSQQQNKWTLISDVIQAGKLVWEAHAGYTVLTAVLTIIQGGIPAIHLWISKLLIDAVAATIQGQAPNSQQSLIYLLTLLVIQAGIFLVSSLLSKAQETINSLLGELLTNKINLKILYKTNSLEMALFENEEFYNKLQNAHQEANYRPLEIVSQIFLLAQTAITISSMMILLLQLNWIILLLILISALPILIVQNRFGFLNYWMLRERSPELRKQSYYGYLLTSDWFIKEIRVFQLEDYFINLYKSLFNKFFSQNRQLIFKKNTGSIFASISSTLGWLLASSYMAWQVVGHAITIGDFALYAQAISATQNGIQSLLYSMSQVYANLLFLRNLFEFLALPTQSLSAGNKLTEPIKEIEFRNVSFSYPETERLALNKISFKIQQGQSLALVGKNGAGKTTLIKLLCCLYKPTEGEILINGKNITSYSPQSVQQQIAVLFQDYGHYYLTARENIGVGCISSITNVEAIKLAAHRSGANALIESLPNQYETMLGKWFDDGLELSGGEWQKIALARGLNRTGTVLILDEPTASLDAEAEFEVFQNLTNNSANQITLLISHRFSTVRIAGNILVLDDGHCVETGSHDELLIANGKYAKLFRLQARGYETESWSKTDTYI